ncbi:hypothetical protein ACWCOT_23395 [Nonomuraea bangladeshensis]
MRISIQRLLVPAAGVTAVLGLAALLPITAASATSLAPSCYSVTTGIGSVKEGADSKCSNTVDGYVHKVRITCEVSNQGYHYTLDGPWKLVGTATSDISRAVCDWWDPMTWHQSIVAAVDTLSSEEQAELLGNAS